MSDEATGYNEPWAVTGQLIDACCISDSIGQGVADMYYREPEAARIVACVNACQGFTDAELEQIISRGGFKGMQDLME